VFASAGRNYPKRCEKKFRWRRPRHGAVELIKLFKMRHEIATTFGGAGLDDKLAMSRAAFAARAHWLTVEWLPKYAPELNDIEVVWHDLKAHHLAHQTFTDIAALDQAIHAAVEDINRERMVDPLAELRISA
jgi:transposase